MKLEHRMIAEEVGACGQKRRGVATRSDGGEAPRALEEAQHA